MSQDEDLYIQALMNLGLTLLQATIYLTLAQIGQSEVKRISKASNVARPDVYRVMPTLEKIDLVEKIVANPTVYKAVPLKEGLSILLQEKTEENVELQKETKALLSNFQENNVGISLDREDPELIITSGKNLFLKRFEKAIKAGQTSEDIIGTAPDFNSFLFRNLQYFKTVNKKGVKIRVITKPENQESMLRVIREFKKNPLFKLKYTFDNNPVCLMICDNKEVNFQISNGMVPSLWSNEPHVVQLARVYFESLWKEANEVATSPKSKKRVSKQNRNNRRHNFSVTTSISTTNSTVV